MANSRFPIISVHGNYFEVNYGDILLIRLYSKWISEAYGDKVLINYPLADQKTIKNFTTNRGLTGLINLCRSKALIYVGGGHFGEPPNNVTHWSKRNFKRHIVVGLIAILFRIPIAIIGLEYGPLTNRNPFFRRMELKRLLYALMPSSRFRNILSPPKTQIVFLSYYYTYVAYIRILIC